MTRDPQHPYTQKLLLAAPVPDPDRQQTRREERRRLVMETAGQSEYRPTEAPTGTVRSVLR